MRRLGATHADFRFAADVIGAALLVDGPSDRETSFLHYGSLEFHTCPPGSDVGVHDLVSTAM